MKNILYALLIFSIALVSDESFAIAEGDEIINILIKVNESSGIDMRLSRNKYGKHMTDEDYRSVKPEMWLLVMKDRDGKKIEEAYFRFKENQVDLIRAPIGDAAKAAEPYDWATMVFRYSRNAEKVDLYNGKELVASAQVPHKRLKK